MHPLPRRHFLATLPLAAAVAAIPSTPSTAVERTRRFSMDLTPGAIGVSGDPFEMIRLAAAHGFESVQPDAGFLTKQNAEGIDRVREALKKAGLRWGSAGLPVEFRRDDETFLRDLERLPATAKALRLAGATRIGTWIMPGHNELDERENFRRHALRLKEVALRLHAEGVHLGLEYVGTPSLRTRFKFPFVHRLSQTRDLIAAIDVPGTGVILDSWHWWLAGDDLDALRRLRREDVIAVDLNDAPVDIPSSEQQDGRRELPAATGVIPVAGFLRALLDMDYDGPIRAEPFNAPLNALDNEAACARTAEALRKAFALASA